MSSPSEAIDTEATAVAVREPDDLVPTMVSDVAAARARLKQLQDFVQEVMIENEDYGIIPGTAKNKPVLLKPGAEKLCEIYGYAPHFEVMHRLEDWDRPFFAYEVKCDLISKRTGRTVGSGLGSCNSMESKYRWRAGTRHCPQCNAEAIIKGKEEYGGGWVCFRKKGGCGAKFADDYAGIIEQSMEKVPNEDVCDLVNTFLKMATKRAHIAATLGATRSSALFTQDVEDLGTRDAREERRESDGDPNTERLATSGQVALIHTKAKAVGVTEETLHTHVYDAFRVSSAKQLRFVDVNAVLDWLTAQQQPKRKA